MLQSSFLNTSHGSQWHRIHTYHQLDCHIPSIVIPNSHPYGHSPLKTLTWQLHVASTRSQWQWKILNALWNPSDSVHSLWRKKPSWYLGSCILPASRTVNGLSSHHWAANASENQEFGNICFTEKSKDSKHTGKTFWKKTNSSGEQWGDWDTACTTGQKSKWDICRCQSQKKLHSPTLSHCSLQGYPLQKIHFQECQVTLLFNLVSHLSQTYLKTERERKISWKKPLHITTKTTIT